MCTFSNSFLNRAYGWHSTGICGQQIFVSTKPMISMLLVQISFTSSVCFELGRKTGREFMFRIASRRVFSLRSDKEFPQGWSLGVVVRRVVESAVPCTK